MLIKNIRFKKNWSRCSISGSGNKICYRKRVVDPYSFFPDPDTDPDPEFDVGDQYGSGSGSNTDPGL